MSKTFNISPGGNTVIQGQPVVLDGKLTGGSATGLKGINVFLNGITPGSWASGDDFEFNPFVDQISSAPNMVVLNASFVGLGFTEVNATTLGVSNINLKLGEGDVVIDGGNVTAFDTTVKPNFSGLQTLTLLQSAGGFLTFGSASNPLFVQLTTINAQAATAKGSGIDVNIDPSVFPTSPVAVKFNLNTVGNGPGTHTSESDDYVHGAREVFAVGYGTSDGATTATTWNLNVTGKNFVELFTHGATNTTTVNMTGAGSLTLFGVADEFANVTTINDKATGAQVITGALQEDGSSKSYTGFLADNTALTSITVSSTSAANFVDLSGFDSLAGIAVSIGGGTVVLDSEVLTGLSAALSLGKVTNIGWGGDDGSGPGDAGTINWNFLPSSANTLTFYHGVEDAPTLSVLMTPNTFTMNLQDENFDHVNFIITAATPTAGNTFNLDLGSNAGTIGVLGSTGDVPHDINENWAVTGYQNINIKLAGTDSIHLGSEGGFFASSGVGDNSVDISISGALIDGTDVQEMHFGNISGVDLDDYISFNSFAATDARGVVTHDGTITDTATVFLELGATDASLIAAGKGHGLDMEDPGTDIDGTFTVTGSSNNFNNLQGTLGLVQNLFGVVIPSNLDGAIDGFAGDAIITGGNVADHIWDTGGKTTINVNNTHTKIFVDQFQLNSDDNFAFAITDNVLLGTPGQFVNNGGFGPKVATINGFTPGFNDGSNTSWVDFAVASWADSQGNYRGLVDGSVNEVSGSSHFASVSIITGTNGDVAAGSDLIAYALGGAYANATKVAAAITSAAGAVDFAGTFLAGKTYDILVAYANSAGGTNIADIQFKANATGGLTTANSGDFSGHDLVHLVGVSLGSVEGSLLGSNDVVHFNGA